MEFCPICYEHIRRDHEYKPGDIFICDGCELPLLIESVHPLRFASLEPVCAPTQYAFH